MSAPTVLREGGADLVDTVVHRLQDETLLDDSDLKESLAQVLRGEFTIVRPAPPSA